MRLWHYKLLPYLPELQFKGQLRELVAIMRDIRNKGKTNHLLINRTMNYPFSELVRYMLWYDACHYYRYGYSIKQTYIEQFNELIAAEDPQSTIFNGWHNKDYLRVCMANLYEKHVFGVGKSRINEDEWDKLLAGYKAITGEDYTL